MANTYILKEQALFLMEFYSKIFKKEIPVSFQLVSKSLDRKGYVVSINPFKNSSLSIDRAFEAECKNIKTLVGLKRKAYDEFKSSNQDSFNISSVLLDKIDDFYIVPVKNNHYWESNPDQYLDFIDFACEKIRQCNYKKDYLFLINSLTTKSYFNFIADIPGLEERAEKKMIDNHFLDNPFWQHYRKMQGDCNSYIRNNADILITQNLERFFELDESRHIIFENSDWRKYYLFGIMNAILDPEINLLKNYENNPKFKSALDFLATQYSDEISPDVLKYFKENKIGLKTRVNNDLFIENNQLSSINIELSFNKIKECVPLALFERSDFKKTLGLVIAGVIMNVNNDIEAKTFISNSNNELLVNILSNGDKSEDYFRDIIKKIISEINILSVESHNYAIIDKMSIIINEMLMSSNMNNSQIDVVKKIRKM